MTTNLTAWTITEDQNLAVTMTFEIEATGNPDAGFLLTRAVLVELAVWLDCDKAEPAQGCCIDKTRWLEKFLAVNDGEQRRLDEALAAEWERDHADDDVYASPSWRQAVLAGVD